MRIRLAVLALALAATVAAAEDPKKPADGWIDLMKPDVWKKYDPKGIATDAVKLTPDKKDPRLVATPKEGGTIWVNGEGRLPDLITKQEFGDCEVHAEFLIAKGSNAG